jgi:hypothetical protein
MTQNPNMPIPSKAATASKVNRKISIPVL